MGLITTGQQPEDVLAGYAQYQGQTNSCGEFAVATSLSLLESKPDWLTGQAVVEVADQWTLLDSVMWMGLLGVLAGRSLRMWPGGPTTLWQVANLARKLAQSRGMAVNAQPHLDSTPEDLVKALGQPRTVAVVIVAWDDKTQAKMDDPNQAVLALSSRPKIEVGNVTIDYSGHVMVLGARDPDQNRWGFINSWYQGAEVKRLCWMTDADFAEVWGYGRSPFFLARTWVSIALG